VTRGLDLRLFDPKINGFPGLNVEHLSVKFGDRICINVELMYGKTDTQTNSSKNPNPTILTFLFTKLNTQFNTKQEVSNKST